MSKDALNICTTICCLVALVLAVVAPNHLAAAEYQTPNFIIRNVPTNELAKHFGDTAEKLRHDLAVLWLGQPLPRWSAPCPIVFKVGDFGAGGQTSFLFTNDQVPFSGEVFDWEMEIQGNVESLTTAVLPHEITHMIMASHFRCPLPRWLDEGMATSVENEAERDNYRRQLYGFLRNERGIPFNTLVKMKKYPDDIMPLYAQGFSIVEYLIAQRDHQYFIRFAEAGMVSGDWGKAVRDYYGFDNLGDLQLKWVDWVALGCPPVDSNAGENRIAANSPSIEQVSFEQEAPQPMYATPNPKVGQLAPVAVTPISPSQLSSTPFDPTKATNHTSAHPGHNERPVSNPHLFQETRVR